MTEFVYVHGELIKQLSGFEGFIGAMLLGSISAGMDDETSDYDIQLVFADEALEKHPEYRHLPVVLRRRVDCWTTSESELEVATAAVRTSVNCCTRCSYWMIRANSSASWINWFAIRRTN